MLVFVNYYIPIQAIDGLHLTSWRPCWRYNTCTKECIINSIVGSSRSGWLTLSATSREIDCKPRIVYLLKISVRHISTILTSLSERTRTSYHSLMSIPKQPFLANYFLMFTCCCLCCRLALFATVYSYITNFYVACLLLAFPRAHRFFYFHYIVHVYVISHMPHLYFTEHRVFEHMQYVKI